MRPALKLLIAVTPLLAAAPGLAEQAKPDKATYITKEEVEAVNRTPGSDRNIKVVDIGYENFAVGIVHRGKTVNGREGSGPRMTLTTIGTCGRPMDKPPEGGLPAGIVHTSQTEGYYIVSGGGTMFTDGYIVNGRLVDMTDLNGPTCFGTVHGATVKTVKAGDIIIIPEGVVHGWIDVPDHVDYLSFRPSRGILTAGWVNPAIEK
jgi:mannose-6-phosphate isomerase-like protein (cupin superfamily)